jgi:DNA-binding beta-propeller fold protein YncE
MPKLTLLALALLAAPVAEPASRGEEHAPIPSYSIQTIDLGTTYHQGFFMDYLAYDPETDRVWVPAGATGEVDVVEGMTVHPIAGFATKEVESHGNKRTIGPSAASVGDGVVYVGNRADQKICAVDARTLKVGICGEVDSSPDGVAYVRSKREVWVTTPRDQSIRILDATTLAQKARLPFEGEPEGFAVDATRGRFYSNLEDKDVTLAIDLVSHQTVATWKPNCGEEGPHGLRLVEAQGILLVACSAKVEALAAGKDGAIVGAVDTGDGVDDFDYSAQTHSVYVGAARSGNLTIASLDPATGALAVKATVPTEEGARNGVVAANGAVYLAASKAGELVVVSPK